MTNQAQAQLAPEVKQLADLMTDAAKSSPDLWKAIQTSVEVAEFTCSSIPEQKTEGTEISSETETSTVSRVKELK